MNVLLVLMAAVAAVAGGAADTPSKRPGEVVVVGAGIAGLCAALEAARAGAAVAVIDMASVFGGHAVMSSGMVCLVGTPEQEAQGVNDSAERATEDFIRFGDDANGEWASFYARHSRVDVRDWLRELGETEWELYPQIIPGNSVRRQHVAQGRGLGLVSPIYRECLRYGNISWFWNTKVTGLLVESNRVAGVRTIQQRSGVSKEMRASAVILATGGFESNLQLVRSYWPQYFPELGKETRVLLGSGINAVGSGLELATKAGAELARLDHQLFYATGLVDPRDPSGKRGLHAYNRHSIWVNAQGKRFVYDGQPDPKQQIPALLRQTPATYWAIFDAASRPEFFVSGSDWKSTNVVEREIFLNPKLAPWIKRADSIETLAELAGISQSNLVQTIREWNGWIGRREDVAFHRFDQSSEELPPRIEKPPFFAVQLFPLSRKSLGGVAVDLSCRVLDERKKAIPGLYAAGELTGVGGINGRAALEGTMLGPSILMGRMAAKEAAAGLGKELSPPRPRDRQVVSEPPTRATPPEDLHSFREVLGQLLSQKRPGYFHFEKVHTMVLAREYDCGQCHQEASPLALTDEQLNRERMIQACVICHGGVKE